MKTLRLILFLVLASVAQAAAPLPSIQPYITTMAGYGRMAMSPMMLSSTSTTATTLALSSAYSYGVSGAAVLSSFVPAEDGNLTDFWLRVSSFSGTWESTDGVINVEIRDGLNNSNIPGTSLVGSFTMTLTSGTTGWYKKTGLSIALTAGKMYSLVVGDADGGATNYVTIELHMPQGNAQAQTFGLAGRTTTANGFSSAGSGVSQVSTISVLKVGSLYYSGIYCTVASTTSTTAEKGVRFRLSHPAWMIGLTSFDTLPLFSTSTFKLYADGTAPGGTTLWSYTPPATVLNSASSPAGGTVVFKSTNRCYLEANTWYRFTHKPTTATTVPRKASLNAGGDTGLITALNPLAGDYYWIQESGGAWTEDTDGYPLISPVLAPVSMPTVAY